MRSERAVECRTPIWLGDSGWRAGTVQTRLARLVDVGVITGWGPDLDARATDHSVTAFITVSIAQGSHDRVVGELERIHEVLEVHVVTEPATCSAGWPLAAMTTSTT